MPTRPLGLGRLEFAVCCAVVGVLLAVLLGQLSHWQDDARQLRLRAAMAAVNRAIPVFQAQCMRSPGADCTVLSIHGQPIAGAHGHAAASPEGIARLAGLSSEFTLRRTLRGDVPSLTVDLAAPATPACEFTYVQASPAGAAPGIDPATVSCP